MTLNPGASMSRNIRGVMQIPQNTILHNVLCIMMFQLTQVQNTKTGIYMYNDKT